MALTRRSVVLALAALLMSAGLPRAAVSPSDTPPPPAPSPAGSLTGQLLVASPDMFDPRFANTVILMVRHNSEGAFGIVINRPAEDRSIESLLHALGDKAAKVDGSVRIYAGGPVEQRLGFILHSAEYHLAETPAIADRFPLTPSLDVLRAIPRQHGPGTGLVALADGAGEPGEPRRAL